MTMTPIPSAASCADDRMHLGFGADVDAARRLVENQDRRVGVEPLAQHDLLLIAARQLGDFEIDRRRADREPCAEVAGGSPFQTCPNEAEAIEVATQNRQRNVGEDRHRENQPELATVLGHIGDAEVHAIARRADCDRLAVEKDGSRRRRFDAEKGKSDIGAARADESGEAEDLAAVEIEGDAFENAMTTEIGHRENKVLSRRRRSRLRQIDLTADHVGDRALRRRLEARARRYSAARRERP